MDSSDEPNSTRIDAEQFFYEEIEEIIFEVGIPAFDL
jgi:hypothetical protein